MKNRYYSDLANNAVIVFPCGARIRQITLHNYYRTSFPESEWIAWGVRITRKKAEEIMGRSNLAKQLKRIKEEGIV